MIKKMIVIIMFCSLSFVSSAVAVLQVVDSAITTAIENQMPVDRIETHPSGYGKLYCFTKVVGAEGETEVTHVWFYQENELARVALPIRSADWRTYSSKRFLPQWSGQWRVQVLDAAGNELASIPFQLQ